MVSLRWAGARGPRGGRADIGGAEVARYLPTRRRTTVGVWCFFDHYGPDDLDGAAGMRVGPHPHTGLQTVTWLFDGVVVHRDSLGSRQEIRPGQLNLMTAGAGIAHAEESPTAHPRLASRGPALGGAPRGRAVAPHCVRTPRRAAGGRSRWGPRDGCSWARWTGPARRPPCTRRSSGPKWRWTRAPRCRCRLRRRSSTRSRWWPGPR